MKNVIVTVALVVLAAFLSVFQLDINQMEREGALAQFYASEAAGAGAIQIDSEAYAMGYLAFDCEKVAAAVRKSLEYNMELDAGGMSAKGYFADRIDAQIYVFDELGRGYSASLGQDFGEFDFEWGCMFSDVAGTKTVTEDFCVEYPCVCCVLDCGRPRFRLDFLKGLGKIRKLGVYEYASDRRL